MSLEAFPPILEEIRALLLRHGRTWHADYLGKLMALAAEESPEFRRLLIRTVDEMASHGIRNAKAEWVAELFRQDLHRM
jgi:hypothetical protein